MQPAPSRRIPIWVGGMWPNKRPFKRAARWDGVVPMKAGQGLGETIDPWSFGWRWEGPWPMEAMNARVMQGPAVI